MKISSEYNSLLKRRLYDSPLYSLSGKAIFAAIILITLYFSLNTWIQWLTPLENSLIILYGILAAFLGSLMGLVWLRYLDRREPEPWWYFVVVLLITTLLTAAPAAYFNERSPFSTLTVGFIEEFWKVFPLLMLVFFAPTVVTGARDGLIYGALGGFGFNIIEIADYFLRVSFPQEGLTGIGTQLARLGYWGIGNHVIWSMLVGAGIGLAVQTKNRKVKILAPLGAYLLAVVTHTLQDNLVGPLIAVGLLMIILAAEGINLMETSLEDQSELAEQAKSVTSITTPLEALVINIFNLPILIYALLKSGDWERQVIQNELADEVGEAVTEEEYQGVKFEKRFRLRKIPNHSPRLGRALRNAQNNLAFHKFYLKNRNRPVQGDPLIEYWRGEIDRLRTGESK